MNNKLAIRKTGIKKRETLDSLIKSGDFVHVSIEDTEYTKPLSAILIDLPNGQRGIVCSVMQPSKHGSADSISIRTLDGKILGYISEPELEKARSVETRTARDKDALYVVTSNTKQAFIAKYSLKEFSRIWKIIPKWGKGLLNFANIESVEITDNYVIAFNRSRGAIEYYDKETGEFEKEYDMGIHISHHDLASIDGRLISSSSGVNIPNIVEIYDESGEKIIHKRQVDSSAGKIEGLAVDKNNKRIYLSVDNVMVVYGELGCLGAFEMPNCSKVMGIDIDQDSGSVLISNYDQENPKNTGTIILSKSAIEQLTELYKLQRKYLPQGKTELKDKNNYSVEEY